MDTSITAQNGKAIRMYIKHTISGYDRSGEQIARRQLFLILLQRDDLKDNAIRAIVRKVAMRQFGQFMMGFARVKGERITLSGSYGSDGLPKTVSDKVFNEGFPLPDDLRERWNKGGGWNGAGSEANAMREWALANLDKLYRVRK